MAGDTLGTTLNAHAHVDPTKFLLCRPRGGLNDTLCQVERCWRYAESTGRTLIIDSRRSGLMGDFGNFFESRSNSCNVQLSLSASMETQLNRLNCKPACVSGRLAEYAAPYSPAARNHIDDVSGQLLTFDFNTAHSEQVLVHEQCGGGNLSFSALRRLVLSQEIREQVRSSLLTLGSDYLGVHIRNTDYQTEYIQLFEQIYPQVIDRSLLVCSDNADVISAAKNFFDRSRVLTITPPPNGNKPLHHATRYKDDKERNVATTNSLIDLLALGGATKLFYANVHSGHPSGFSTLARSICNNKSLINDLLGLTAHNQPSNT